MSGFDVDTDALRAHASALQALGDGLKDGADAGATTMMQDSAFGILCSFLVVPALAVQASCSAMIAASAVAVDATAASVRTIADGYDAVEDGVRTLMTALTGQVPTD